MLHSAWPHGAFYLYILIQPSHFGTKKRRWRSTTGKSLYHRLIRNSEILYLHERCQGRRDTPFLHHPLIGVCFNVLLTISGTDKHVYQYRKTRKTLIEPAAKVGLYRRGFAEKNRLALTPRPLKYFFGPKNHTKCEGWVSGRTFLGFDQRCLLKQGRCNPSVINGTSAEPSVQTGYYRSIANSRCRRRHSA